MSYNENKIKLKCFLQQILFIACCANFMSYIASNIYIVVTHSPPVNWSIVGRWIYYIFANGCLVNPPINTLQQIQHEALIGLASNYVISGIFALFYIITIDYIFKSKYTLSNGIFIGVLLSVFPFSIELPALGAGILGHMSPIQHTIGSIFGNVNGGETTLPPSIIVRVFLVHSFFGLGLGIGGILFNFMSKKY